jgi:hypothetical protein
MVYLDCQNADTALQSFASACRRPVTAVIQAIRSYEVDESSSDEEAGPRQVFELLNVRPEDFEGTYYFHGTRVLGTASFDREGILPLGQVIDRIWTTLHPLVADVMTQADWRRHRTEIEAGAGADGGYQYRLKTERPTLHGPYAFLVRDHHLIPRDGHHDYLAIPEIVEDIARSLRLDLQSRFEAASIPCLVKFQSAGITTNELHSAFWYVHCMLHHEEPGWASPYSTDRHGTAVPPEEVVAGLVVSSPDVPVQVVVQVVPGAGE